MTSDAGGRSARSHFPERDRDMFNLDIDGFLFSTEFVVQLAALISGIISVLLGDVIAGFFTPSL